ncbi:Uncharacterized protein HZ326_15341 [Fusarium oxysporum f. sp. albedinis]|nr:Uncharacterized protein HZ326_15341 [Fusarium oxysporum f. sp. albedinis]
MDYSIGRIAFLGGFTTKLTVTNRERLGWIDFSSAVTQQFRLHASQSKKICNSQKIILTNLRAAFSSVPQTRCESLAGTTM